MGGGSHLPEGCVKNQDCSPRQTVSCQKSRVWETARGWGRREIRETWTEARGLVSWSEQVSRWSFSAPRPGPHTAGWSLGSEHVLLPALPTAGPGFGLTSCSWFLHPHPSKSLLPLCLDHCPSKEGAALGVRLPGVCSHAASQKPRPGQRGEGEQQSVTAPVTDVQLGRFPLLETSA